MGGAAWAAGTSGRGYLQLRRRSSGARYLHEGAMKQGTQRGKQNKKETACAPSRGNVRAHVTAHRARLPEIAQLCDTGVEHDLRSVQMVQSVRGSCGRRKRTVKESEGGGAAAGGITFSGFTSRCTMLESASSASASNRSVMRGRSVNRGRSDAAAARVHDGSQLPFVNFLAAVLVLRESEAVRAGLRCRSTCCSRCSKLHSHKGNTSSTRDCSLMTAEGRRAKMRRRRRRKSKLVKAAACGKNRVKV